MEKYKKYIPYIALIVTCIAVYFPILGNDFQYNWDDQWVVMNYYTEGGLNFNNFVSILTEYYHGQYGPLNQYMLLFLYNIFGYDAFAFHATSLFIHIANVCLVFICFKKILEKNVRIKTDSAKLIAFLTALIFSIHPMNVESVAWMSAVKILNYTFFYLAATYTFLKFLEKTKIVYLIFTVILFTLSFGGKEQAVTFPLWLLLIYWLYGYSFKARKLWVQVTPFFVLSIVFGIITMLSQSAVGAGVLTNEESYPLWQRFILGCYSLFEYIAKFLFPYKLMHVYPFPMIIGEPLPGWMLFYPAFIVIIAITLTKYISKPVATGLIFFFIHIAIALHIIPLSRFAVIADRYIYVASIGLSFIISYYFVLFISKKKGVIKNTLSIFFACIILYLGVFSYLRSQKWIDSESIKKELRELIKQRPDYTPEKYKEFIEPAKQKEISTESYNLLRKERRRPFPRERDKE